MKYLITAQYTRENEKPIAEFIALTDAQLFMLKKLLMDEHERTKRNYRLYCDSDLVQTFTQENSYDPYMESTDGEEYFNQFSFIFQVVLQPPSSIERKNIANFNEKQDAELFVLNKCQMGQRSKVGEQYYVLKDQYVVSTSNQLRMAQQKKESEAAQGNLNGALFNPSPMPIIQKPPGFPSNVWGDEEDETK